MREPKFRYEYKGEMKCYTLYQIMYGYVEKSILHPEHYRGEWTGLHDKNGKEIYEGDIVKWDDRSNGKYWRVAVVEIAPDIQYRVVENSLYPLSTSMPKNFHHGNFAYRGNDLEIIGNIYENPELLKS